MSENPQDPNVARLQELQRRWPFLRHHEDHIQDMEAEHGRNSQQHTDAVMAELAEYRKDAMRPDSDTYKSP